VIRSGTGAPAEVFFEDMTVGSVYDLGTVVVDHDEMLAFAQRFDPQWYHVNADLAKDSPFGQIIASGFFTAALFMRAYVDHVLTRAAGNASPGLEELRWLAPVYAGDRLSTRLEVLGAETSQSRPGFGTLKLQATMVRGTGATATDVMRTTFRGWFAKRPT
jgi:acyl dehydratase